MGDLLNVDMITLLEKKNLLKLFRIAIISIQKPVTWLSFSSRIRNTRSSSMPHGK